jgi:hypothetical protein
MTWKSLLIGTRVSGELDTRGTLLVPGAVFGNGAVLRKRFVSGHRFTACGKIPFAEERRPQGLNSLLKKSAGRTSGAEARVKDKRLIAAVNRCATQQQSFSANREARAHSKLLTRP